MADSEQPSQPSGGESDGTPLTEYAIVDIDVCAWQRELGKTAFHLACVERDYSLGAVMSNLPIPENELRAMVAEEVNIPSVDMLESPPPRDGATQVYVLGSVAVEVSTGDVVSSNFDPENRRYVFVGKDDTSLDVSPIRTDSHTEGSDSDE